MMTNAAPIEMTPKSEVLRSRFSRLYAVRNYGLNPEVATQVTSSKLNTPKIFFAPFIETLPLPGLRRSQAA